MPDVWKNQRLFPLYMNSESGTGDRSHGGAVTILKILFFGTKYYDRDYEINFVYCNGLVRVIKRFQKIHGIEEDGNFGPDTREKFKEEFGLDVNAVNRNIFARESVIAQDDGKMINWPPL